MIKVFENELKSRLAIFLSYVQEQEADSKNKTPSLGKILWSINKYKNEKTGKQLLNQSTRIHKNNALMRSLDELNTNYRNAAAHTEIFHSERIKELYEFIMGTEECLLAKFIDHLDPSPNYT